MARWIESLSEGHIVKVADDLPLPEGWAERDDTEPTDEMVEAAADVLLEGAGPIARVHFRTEYKATARKVLRAALAVAPAPGGANRAIENSRAALKRLGFRIDN